MAAESGQSEGESRRHLLPNEFRRIQELVLVLAEEPSCHAARLDVLETRLAEAQRDNAALRTGGWCAVNAQLTAAVSARDEHIAALTQTAASTEKLRQVLKELEGKHAAEIKELEGQVDAGLQLLTKTTEDAAEQLARERKAIQALYQQQNMALQQQVETLRQQLVDLRHSMMERDVKCAEEGKTLRRQLAEARASAANSSNESASLAQMHNHYRQKLHAEQVARDQTVGQLQARISELERDVQAARMQRTHSASAQPQNRARQSNTQPATVSRATASRLSRR